MSQALQNSQARFAMRRALGMNLTAAQVWSTALLAIAEAGVSGRWSARAIGAVIEAQEFNLEQVYGEAGRRATEGHLIRQPDAWSRLKRGALAPCQLGGLSLEQLRVLLEAMVERGVLYV